MKPVFFRNQSELHRWFEEYHNKKDEVLIGFYKKSSKKPSITWEESVDEALCFGWIDGIRKSLDEISYTIRFTPRRNTSKWSTKNINRVEELIKLKQMKPSGLAAYKKRKEANSHTYSFEQRTVELDKNYEMLLKKKHPGMGVLYVSGTILSKACYTLGYERETGINKIKTAGDSYKLLRSR